MFSTSSLALQNVKKWYEIGGKWSFQVHIPSISQGRANRSPKLGNMAFALDSFDIYTISIMLVILLSWRKGLLRFGRSLLPSTICIDHSVPIATAWFHAQIGTGFMRFQGQVCATALRLWRQEVVFFFAHLAQMNKMKRHGTGRQRNNIQSIQSFVSFAILYCGSNCRGFTKDQLHQLPTVLERFDTSISVPRKIRPTSPSVCFWVPGETVSVHSGPGGWTVIAGCRRLRRKSWSCSSNSVFSASSTGAGEAVPGNGR